MLPGLKKETKILQKSYFFRQIENNIHTLFSIEIKLLKERSDDVSGG